MIKTELMLDFDIGIADLNKEDGFERQKNAIITIENQ